MEQWREDVIVHYNHYHDKLGRFTNTPGSVRRARDREFFKKVRTEDKFERKIERKVVNVYNKSSRIFNKKLKEINAKYEGTDLDIKAALKGKKKPGKIEKQYIEELGKAWTDIFGTELKNAVGPDPINNGYDWVKKVWAYNMYEDFFD